MAGNELMQRSALEQARLIRDGDITARELVEASLSAIERLNGELNAFVTLCDERALDQADDIQQGDERPMAGVPIAIKDLTALTGGIRTTAGMRALEDWVPRRDSVLVARLRSAGAIVVGKTNCPELGILPVTEPELHGPARNPWDTSRTPGGSSGGSAAAVASGMVALGHGNDGGGSIRIPAACCGLVGLKPTRGRISLAPDSADAAAGFDIDGCLSRTVADTAEFLDIVSGNEPGDTFLAASPSAPFDEAPRREPGSLRVGFTTEAPNGVPVDEEWVKAVRDAAALLESLGHRVEEATPAWSDEGYVDNFIRVWIPHLTASLENYARLSERTIERSQLEPLTRQMTEMSDGMKALDYLGALDWLRRFARRVAGLWREHDVLITPALAGPPIPIGALEPDDGEPPIQMLLNSAGWVPFTPAFNVTGQPAISLPLAQSGAGLPIGVQFVGPAGREELLLSLAAQIERARPWAERRPALATAG
ncbi:MAG: amidase [Gaiellaceae bacterium]